MCLVIVSFQQRVDAPLVVGANRDEWLDRPSTPWGLLRTTPATLGGRDDVAGGTWLAVNENGVVAALTNRPARGGRDRTKRSRGELPLEATLEPTAIRAVDRLRREIHPDLYNPAWMLVGDRQTLFYVAVEPGSPLRATRLDRGLHVLENRPLGAPSAKVRWVREALGDSLSTGAVASARRRLEVILASHERSPRRPGEGEARGFPPEIVDAACVHAGPYGTRSSSIVVLGADATSTPAVWVAEGAPCSTPFLPLAWS